MTEGSGGGSVQGYNSQIAVSDDHLILGVHVSQDANDPTAGHRLWRRPPPRPRRWTTRSSWCWPTPATSPRTTSPPRARPADRLRQEPRGPPRRRTPAHPGATTAGPSPTDAMRHRLREPENARLYKRRSATVEPVIAHLKDQTGFRRFARRGSKPPPPNSTSPPQHQPHPTPPRHRIDTRQHHRNHHQTLHIPPDDTKPQQPLRRNKNCTQIAESKPMKR